MLLRNGKFLNDKSIIEKYIDSNSFKNFIDNFEELSLQYTEVIIKYNKNLDIHRKQPILFLKKHLYKLAENSLIRIIDMLTFIDNYNDNLLEVLIKKHLNYYEKLLDNIIYIYSELSNLIEIFGTDKNMYILFTKTSNLFILIIGKIGQYIPIE
jgi:hypothetical protein